MRYYDGEHTFTNVETGEHRTFRIKTQPADAEFAPGRQVLGVLEGPDNTADYKNFAFIRGDKVCVWKRYHTSLEYVAYAGLVVSWFTGFGPWDREGDLVITPAKTYRVEESRRCYRCGRLLTTPESIAAGIGPVCAGRR